MESPFPASVPVLSRSERLGEFQESERERERVAWSVAMSKSRCSLVELSPIASASMCFTMRTYSRRVAQRAASASMLLVDCSSCACLLKSCLNGAACWKFCFPSSQYGLSSSDSPSTCCQRECSQQLNIQQNRTQQRDTTSDTAISDAQIAEFRLTNRLILLNAVRLLKLLLCEFYSANGS